MIALNAHFDGKVLVPDEPLNLAPNVKVRITVEEVTVDPPVTGKRLLGQQPDFVLKFAPDWNEPLPDDIWEHNKQEDTRIDDQNQNTESTS